MMKKTIKRLLTGFLTASMVFGGLSLTGCHGAKETLAFSIPEEFDTSKSYELTFWAKNDTNKKQVDIYKKAVADFHELYPNVTVNVRFYTDYARIYNDVITNIATGTTPNVCITYPDNIATYMTGENVVVPLDELMVDTKYGLGGSEVKFDSPKADELIEEYRNEGYLNGHYYAVPFMRSTEACYINKDFVEALGYTVPDVLTWDFIWEVSEAATKKNADGTYALNGQKVMIPFIYKSTDNMMIQYLKQSNAGYSNIKGDIEIFNDTTKNFLTEISSHVTTGAFSTFKISSYPANFLNAGQCVFAIDSTAGSTWMGSDAPLMDIAQENVVHFETVVRPVPQVNPNEPQMISQGPSICIFNKPDSNEVLASWLFTQFLLSNDVQIGYAETEGYVPVTKTARADANYQEYLAQKGTDKGTHYSVKIDAVEMLLEHTEDTFVTNVFNGSASLRDASGSLIELTVRDTKKQMEINEEYLDGLFDTVTSLYHLDQISVSAEGKEKLGKLPNGSRALLIGLGCVWVVLAGAFLAGKWKEKRMTKKK